jgi:hypothetical protein
VALSREKKVLFDVITQGKGYIDDKRVLIVWK